MRTARQNDPAAIDLFVKSLDLYENTVSQNTPDPVRFAEPAMHLQMAISRLITATIPDSFSMLRILTKRVFAKNDTAYSQGLILLCTASSSASMIKDDILVIFESLRNVIEKKPVDFGLQWFSRVGHNPGIKAFFESYGSSDLYQIAESYPGNILPSEAFVVLENGTKVDTVVMANAHRVVVKNASVIALRHNPTYVKPISFKPQYSHLICGTVNVTSKSGVFYLDPSFVFSTSGKKSFYNLTGTEPRLDLGKGYPVGLPGYFHTCRIHMFLSSSTNVWTIAFIEFIPPVKP